MALPPSRGLPIFADAYGVHLSAGVYGGVCFL